MLLITEIFKRFGQGRYVLLKSPFLTLFRFLQFFDSGTLTRFEQIGSKILAQNIAKNYKNRFYTRVQNLDTKVSQKFELLAFLNKQCLIEESV